MVEPLEILSAASGIIGVVVGFGLSEWKEHRRRAVLNFNDIELYHFSNSVRFVLPVKHSEDTLPVNNASGYLTIYLKKDELKEKIPEDLIIEKVDSSHCSIRECKLCAYKTGDINLGSKPYLAPYPKAKVLSELLPWTVPIPAGEGLDGLEYKHLTNIPVRGFARLVLFDLYKATKAGEEFYLLKVHSEYGTEQYPRICLKLPIGLKLGGELIFDIKVSGENVRGQARAQIKIMSDVLGDYLAEYYIKGKFIRNFSF